MARKGTQAEVVTEAPFPGLVFGSELTLSSGEVEITNLNADQCQRVELMQRALQEAGGRGQVRVMRRRSGEDCYVIEGVVGSLKHHFITALTRYARFSAHDFAEFQDDKRQRDAGIAVKFWALNSDNGSADLR